MKGIWIFLPVVSMALLAGQPVVARPEHGHSSLRSSSHTHYTHGHQATNRNRNRNDNSFSRGNSGSYTGAAGTGALGAKPGDGVIY